MGWNRLAKFTNVNDKKHWLGCLKQDAEEKNRKELSECLRRLRRGIAHDEALLPLLTRTVELVRLEGRVDGLREGLEIYEVGQSILDSENKAIFYIVKYLHTHPNATSSLEICRHLDDQLDRVKETQKTAESTFAPRDDWACKTWEEAFGKKRNDVDVLFTKARNILRDNGDELLAAILWAKWGEPKRRATRKVKKKKPRRNDATDQMNLLSE